jgi:uncharacterized protein YggE
MENRRGGELIGAVIIFFVALFVYTKFVGPVPFTVNNVNTLNSTPFQAQGAGKAAAAPDTAVINLGITQSGQTVEEAQGKTNDAANKIIAGLKAAGVDEKDIKTTNYSVQPNYSAFGVSQKINSYSVTQTFEVKVPIDQANTVVDTATSNGANLIGDISFTLSDAKEQALKNTARQEAVNNAKESAQGLAKASGIKLGRIVNVQESNGGDVVRPMTVALDAKAAGTEASPTNITPGQSNVEVTVTLTYEVN